MTSKSPYEAIVLGVSAGGTEALKALLPCLPGSFALPLIIVQHRHIESSDYFINYLNRKCSLTVKEADEKEEIKKGFIYIAPAGYHLLIEEDKTFGLSLSELVNFSRPSIDVLFETAADVYASKLIGVILTGANTDGSKGLKMIKEKGGMAIVEDPKTAEIDSMPKSALAEVKADYIKNLNEIGPFLAKIKG